VRLVGTKPKGNNITPSLCFDFHRNRLIEMKMSDDDIMSLMIAYTRNFEDISGYVTNAFVLCDLSNVFVEVVSTIVFT
jgi:hypothetical protein